MWSLEWNRDSADTQEEDKVLSPGSRQPCCATIYKSRIAERRKGGKKGANEQRERGAG